MDKAELLEDLKSTYENAHEVAQPEKEFEWLPPSRAAWWQVYAEPAVGMNKIKLRGVYANTGLCKSFSHRVELRGN